MPTPEQEHQWTAMLRQLEGVHRLLYMYLKQARFEGVDGDAVLLAVDDKDRLQELEQGVTQYGESLRRYLPNFFGPQAYCVVRTGTGTGEALAAPEPAAAPVPAPAPEPAAPVKAVGPDSLAASLAEARASGDADIMLRVGLKAVHEDLQRGEGFELLGDAFAAKGENAKALSMWVQAGEACLTQGKADKAAELTARVLKAQPQHAVAVRLWERLPWPSKEKAGFLPSAAPALPPSPAELAGLAEQEVYQAKKHLDQAIAHFRQAVKQAPADAEIKAKLNALYKWMAEA
jgi:tetratricopeptide (TPR) repeat protein